MTFDPNNPRPDRDLRPELNISNEPLARKSPSWMPWLAILVVALVGVFAWSQMSGPNTDPATTSSTMPPAATQQAPAPVTPTVPATPPANNAAPASPNTGGTQTQP
ncbi:MULTISPECIES: hypothetical protein [Rhizobium/Agrobacterium group]|jgi:hypothetical protein|uniref:Uncharacterized protein n=2 Tax=Rhizobium/Agrobacterium group TaxID=227290 RepID=A0A1B9TNV5_AGRTU|nr:MULTISPECIES: hypothetical protein [Rhizobium/Agrobacterium group]EHJ98078.1 hypothetical protein AT5A_11087 [Agrobacterium tumefaciens 5A]MDP9560022.1 hypothetical protein [Rhizobium nepotum]QDG91995.1 hypothetical protein NIBR502774_05420 [Rhizobium sp. NIBRBAC000502774]ADY63215.1 hypothetical protein AGROH133_03316 [Agrobacterium tumefaciens]AYM12204.1 hypothetical protein At1D1108_25780 [Agrobacterium tumefaciens]